MRGSQTKRRGGPIDLYLSAELLTARASTCARTSRDLESREIFARPELERSFIRLGVLLDAPGPG